MVQYYYKKNLSNSNLDEIILDFYKSSQILEQSQINISDNNKAIIKSHPQAYHISRLLNFTEKLNKALTQNIENSQNIGNY